MSSGLFYASVTMPLESAKNRMASQKPVRLHHDDHVRGRAAPAGARSQQAHRQSAISPSAALGSLSTQQTSPSCHAAPHCAC